jgi:hypothetical protein
LLKPISKFLSFLLFVKKAMLQWCTFLRGINQHFLAVLNSNRKNSNLKVFTYYTDLRDDADDDDELYAKRGKGKLYVHAGGECVFFLLVCLGRAVKSNHSKDRIAW